MHMKNWAFILILLPATAMAGEGGWGNFFNRFFPSTTQAVTGTVDSVTAPATGQNLSNQIDRRMNYQPTTQQAYPQYGQQYAQPYAPQTGAPIVQQQAASEDLIRCVYLGKYIEQNRALLEESVDAQRKAQLYSAEFASKQCRAKLEPYKHVFADVDNSMNTCFANEECQSLGSASSSGGLKQ